MNNKVKTVKKEKEAGSSEPRKLTEIKYQESPFARALKLSSEQALAMAIRDIIKRDELN